MPTECCETYRGNLPRAPRGGVKRLPSWLMWVVCAVVVTPLAERVHAQEPEQDIPQADASLANVPLSGIPGAAPTTQRSGPAKEPQAEVRTLCEAAADLMDEAEVPQALVKLKAALHLPGGLCYDVLYLTAEAEARMGHFGEARLAAEHACAYRPDSAEAHVLLGRLYHQRGWLNQAIEHFRSATLVTEAVNPRVSLAWYQLAECLSETGHLWAAAQAFERFDRAIWEEHPAHRREEKIRRVLNEHPYGAITQRLDLLGRLERKDELAKAAQWAVDSRPDEPYLERLYVRSLLEIGEASRAFAFCQERLTSAGGGEGAVPTTQPVQPRAVALVTLAVEAGQASGDLQPWVNQLAEQARQGQDMDLPSRLARRFDEMGRHDLSIPLWSALIKAPVDGNAPSPRDRTDPAWALANALKESGDLKGALDSLIGLVRKCALAEDSPRVAIPPKRLAGWMRSFEASDKFLRLVSGFTEREDCDFATYTVLGATAAAAGQRELAERLFRSALDERPDFALAHLAWGWALIGEYQWEDALAQAEAALTVAPGLAAAHLLRGEAYTGLDQFDQAEAACKAALEADPDEVTCVLGLAEHYRRTGNLLAAQRYLQQAWSMDGTLGEAVEELVDSYLEGGKFEVARARLKEAEASDVSPDTLRRIRTALRFAANPMDPEHLAELQRQFESHPDDSRTGLKLAAGLYLNHRIDDSFNVLRTVRERDADNERLPYLLARVHLQRLEGEQAARVMETVTERFPRRRNGLHLLADCYLSEFRLRDAREVLKRILALDLSPDLREQYQVRLLATFVEFGEFDEALRLVDDWMALAPETDTWIHAKLRVLLSAERDDEAVELAEQRLLTVEGECAELRAQAKALADKMAENADDAEAEARLRAIEREVTGCLTKLLGRRSEYMQVAVDGGQHEAAERRVRGWLEDQPDDWQTHEWLLELLLTAEKPDEATEALAWFVPRTPVDVLKVLTWRARCSVLADNVNAAVDGLRDLLAEGYIRENAIARGQVRQQLLTHLTDAGEFDRAVSFCDDWLADVAEGDELGRLEVLTLKRWVLQMTDREDEALDIGEELLAAQPHDAGLNNDLGYTWADRGEHLDRALAMIKVAVAAEPMNAAFLDSLGWAYYKMGDFDAARTYLSRSVALESGQDPLVYDHLADVEYRLGDQRAAEGHWRKALTLLNDSDAEPQPALYTRLIAAVRAKLQALESSGRPALAPTAAEQKELP